MDRRLALKQLALLTGGAVLIPSCDFSQESALVAYKKLQITASDKATLTDVVNTIFPGIKLKKGDEVDVPDFVLIMANDCLSKEEQSSFVAGLKAMDAYTKKTFGKTLGMMEAMEAAATYRQLMAKEDGQAAKVKDFLSTTKRFALQGFLTSAYYMTEIMPYTMIPGGYRGSVPVSEIERINTNG
ncbi:MAG: gluconate 2-dehydrogenase subunit 3 family protein [Lunatimonas sp.]|uniref:gluconate 2-dehydrogenase subunit 3 family protein n=1 Tax=Lunatimonas sp. TaxID=2060141 RepID=UPI00263B9BA0|nr:gluconate 2-dehydrogenase subunit 3 family protein [Lunatimonas sp.]MCC5937565.1 gluconate 2-dehydrogenase subunit 3 family protein [Lunatimonas sp.]